MQKLKQKRSLKDYFKLYFSGILMGSADLVPGVSGGTMAFILGIYEELISAISSINKDLITKVLKFKIKDILNTFPWQFLTVLGFGIITAILSLSHGLEYLLKNQPVYIWSFFTGLILASVPAISNRVKKWGIKPYFSFAIGVIFAFILVGLAPSKTPDTPLFLLLSGALASMAMILPGISGSFILVLLGKYETVLSAVNNRDFITVGLVAIGAVLGLILFSKLLKYIFANYHDLAVSLLAGFVLGAVRKIWPFKIEKFLGETFERTTSGDVIFISHSKIVNVLPNLNSPEHLIGLFLVVVGGVFVYFINKMAVKTPN